MYNAYQYTVKKTFLIFCDYIAVTPIKRRWMKSTNLIEKSGITLEIVGYFVY